MHNKPKLRYNTNQNHIKITNIQYTDKPTVHRCIFKLLISNPAHHSFIINGVNESFYKLDARIVTLENKTSSNYKSSC